MARRWTAGERAVKRSGSRRDDAPRRSLAVHRAYGRRPCSVGTFASMLTHQREPQPVTAGAGGTDFELEKLSVFYGAFRAVRDPSTACTI